MINCPVCNTPNVGSQDLGYGTGLNCRRCGLIAVFGANPALLAIAQRELEGHLGPMSELKARHRRSRLSHILRRQQRAAGGYAGIPLDALDSWRLDAPLPAAIEQLDSLILAVGDKQRSPGEPTETPVDALAAWLGDAITPDAPNRGLNWLVNQSEAKNIFEQRPGAGAGNWQLSLTMPGWRRYEELKLGRAESRTAFMSMQFGDSEMNKVVDTCFRVAVGRAGFELRVATDKQTAGLIDDQMRVAIRTARFILADLTHGNSGAYWEAGFAEGLGKPVIYTCREAEWNHRKTHFDTNHMVTIVWRADDLGAAVERLVNTIRATLPEEATMTDDQGALLAPSQT